MAQMTLVTTAAERPIAWQPEHDLSFDEWVDVGHKMGQAGRALQFYIGDWVNYGEGRYGEKYEAALAVTGYEYQTLRNFASISAQVPLSRRRDSLSYSHHAEVVALPPAQQDELLGRAEREHMTVRELRKAVPRESTSRTTAKPDTGKRSAKAVESIANQIDALGEAVRELNLSKSCASIDADDRAQMARSIRDAVNAFNALARELAASAQEAQ